MLKRLIHSIKHNLLAAIIIVLIVFGAYLILSMITRYFLYALIFLIGCGI